MFCLFFRGNYLVDLQIKRERQAQSQLIAYGAPSVMQVVATSKNLKEVSLWHEGFANVVNFFRLLGLAAPHAEYHVAVNAAFDAISQVTLVANKASFFRVLKVVAVAFVDLAVNGLLDPDDLIDKPNNNVV